MTDQNNKFKEKLEKEQILLEQELASVGQKNPDNPGDWEATPVVMDTLKADENEVADTIEEYEGNTAILKQLETRYNEVLSAIKRIDAGTYGTCSVCGKPIEADRLEANPAATTCKEHLN
jgi:RNA polymerase-binding transcription factor DksA